MMVKVTLAGPREADGSEKTIDVEVPIVPRVDEYISHDPSGLSGTVRNVMYWWPEDGGDLQIEVRVR